MNANESRPGVGTGATEYRFAGDAAIIPDPAATVTASAALPDNHLEQVTLRMLQDTLAEATTGYWLRRADTLAAGRLRPGDYLGGATYGAVITRHARITLQAEQCRIHATLFDHADVDAALLVAMLGWESAGAIAAAHVVDEDARAAESDRFTAAWTTSERAVA